MLITHYDEAERRAIHVANYPAIRAFAPAHFRLTNFPDRVTEERELVRYADIMNEFEDEAFYYEQKLYSKPEIALMRDVSGVVEEVTASLGQSIQPFMSMFPPITMLRAVQSLKPASVLEVGPGSGYLGAYLIKSGFRYCAADNTQALYLWQNRFFSALTHDFTDYASAPVNSDIARVTHVPWWQFAEMYKAPPKFDVVVCDAALGEMDPFGAGYVVNLAFHVLRDSHIGAFLFRHIGEDRVSSPGYITSRFQKAGFKKQMLEGVTAWTLAKLKPVAGEAYTERACDSIPIDSKRILESYAFLRFADPQT
jgi:hypothetical protein